MEKLQAQYKEALKSGQKRDYQKSIELFQDLLSKSNDFPDALIYLGRAYTAIDDYQKAIGAFKLYLHQSPDDSTAHFHLGRALLSSDKIQGAYFHFKKADSLQTNSASAKSYLGLTMLKLKRPERSLEYLQKAVELDPANTAIYSLYLTVLKANAVFAYRRKNWPLALEMFEFLEIQNKHDVSVSLYLGTIYRHQKQYAKALQYLLTVYEKNTEDESVELLIADLLFKTGQREESLALIKKHYGEAEPELSSFLFDQKLAIQAFQSGKYHECIEFAYAALNHEDHASIHLLIAESALQLGQIDTAEHEFKQTIRLDANLKEAYIGMLIVYWNKSSWSKLSITIQLLRTEFNENEFSNYYEALLLNQQQIANVELIDMIREAIQFFQRDAHLFLALAQSYERCSLGDLSIKWYENALAVNPQAFPAYEPLIEYYEKQNQSKKLINLLESISQHDTSDAYQKLLVKHLLINGNYTKAVKAILSVLHKYRNDFALMRQLAYCYRKTEDFQQAAIIYRHLLKLDPKNETLLAALAYCLNANKERNLAIELLKKADSYFTLNRNLRMILGTLLWKNSDYKAALECFHDVIDEDPENIKALDYISKIYTEQGLHDFASRFAQRSNKLKKKNVKP